MTIHVFEKFSLMFNILPIEPWGGGSVGCSVLPWQIRFLVTAHIQVAGSIPAHNTFGKQPMDVSLFLSLSLKSNFKKLI